LLGNKGRADVLIRPRAAGFTLLELVVTITIFGILTVLAVPSMSQWVRNSKIRAVADSLQNGLRLAQAESLRRSRQMVFSLTTNTTPQNGFTAAGNGTNWSVNTIPLPGIDTGTTFVEAGVLATTSSGITVTGPAEVCFNSIGRLVGNNITGVPGANCSQPPGNPNGGPPVWTYNVTVPGAVPGQDRPLNVTVALGGQVHMCDPAKTLSLIDPDGC
jgi:type IV fimbrial biogenesis protein FimT